MGGYYQSIPIPGAGNPQLPSDPFPSDSSGGIGNTLQIIFNDALKGYQAYSQTQLAQQAIAQPRPTTFSYTPAGTPVITSGGAPSPLSAGAGLRSAFSGWLPLIAVVVVILLLVRR